MLLQQRAHALIAASVAPNLNELALMLPYSPLHHLLLHDFGAALVATSGNLSGEPVLTDPEQVEARLAGIADAFLHHDRPIARPADDPVVRVLASSVRPLRLGRGSAPLELRLARPVRVPTLAVGAYLKTTVALAWGDRAVVSPHIGELASPAGERSLRRSRVICSNCMASVLKRLPTMPIQDSPIHGGRLIRVCLPSRCGITMHMQRQ